MFQRIRSFSIAATLGVAALCAGGANCSPQSDFQCSTDQDCLTQGDGGVCEANAFCSFPDEGCEGGRRWHDRASSLSGMCVGEESGTATDTDPGPTTDTDDPQTTGDTAEPTTAAATTDAPTTDDPTNVTTDPTTGDPTGDPMTGDTSTGGAATCDELYGGSTDYMFCSETEDSCSFNVTVAMAMSCNDVCTAGGGACTGASYNEDPVCTGTGDTGCDDASINDLICVCSKP